MTEQTASRPAAGRDDRDRLRLEARQASEEAAERGRQLELAMASKSRLIRGFAHDIKNPLGAADGRAELLLEGIAGELNDDQVKHVEGIRRSLRAAISLVDVLVEFTRVEAGQIELHWEEIDVALVVRESAEEHRAAALKAGLQLAVLCDQPTQVKTDPERVRQVMSNLLSNAVKYTSQGEIRVCIDDPDDEERAAVKAHVAIRVIDTGRGIPADRFGDVFEEFTRIDPVDNTGAGLGLAISRRIARLLGGDITLRSTEGRGATFSLLLPAECTPPDAAGK